MHDAPFYITLPSDASMEQNSKNTAADWTTKLKHPVSLKGKWEVALVEMQYLNSLSTLAHQQTLVVRTLTGIKGENDKVAEPSFTEHIINFPPGHYSAAEAFLTIIRDNIPELKPLYYLDPPGIDEEASQAPGDKALKVEMFSPTDHRLRITLGSPRVHIHFPSDSLALQKILGFDHNEIYAKMDMEKHPEHVMDIVCMYQREKRVNFKMQPIVAPRPLNPLLGNQSLFVYCDVADYSLMGDTSAQILRTVPIKGQFMELITDRFDIPHYTPVLMSHFENITISIGTDLEETAKFAT